MSYGLLSPAYFLEHHQNFYIKKLKLLSNMFIVIIKAKNVAHTPAMCTFNVL